LSPIINPRGTNHTCGTSWDNWPHLCRALTSNAHHSRRPSPPLVPKGATETTVHFIQKPRQLKKITGYNWRPTKSTTPTSCCTKLAATRLKTGNLLNHCHTRVDCSGQRRRVTLNKEQKQTGE